MSDRQSSSVVEAFRLIFSVSRRIDRKLKQRRLTFPLHLDRAPGDRDTHQFHLHVQKEKVFRRRHVRGVGSMDDDLDDGLEDAERRNVAWLPGQPLFRPVKAKVFVSTLEETNGPSFIIKIIKVSSFCAFHSWTPKSTRNSSLRPSRSSSRPSRAEE